MFFIEIAYISEYYFNWNQVEMAKNKAIEISGLEINLTGRKTSIFILKNMTLWLIGQLGKRTRYQVNDTSQLLLGVTRKECPQAEINTTNIEKEENLILPKVKVSLMQVQKIFSMVFRIWH